MISDKINNETIHKSRAVSAERKWWGDTQKIDAVKTYLMTGDLRLAGNMLKIPEGTIRRWRASVWWNEIVADLKAQDELIISTKLQKIINKTMDVVEDRLEHGDFVYDQKTGAMRRKPVSAKDAAKIGLDYDARRDVLINRHAPVASEEAIDDKLNKLAAKFAALVGAKPVDTSEAIDAEVKVVQADAVGSEVYADYTSESTGQDLQEAEDSDSFDGGERGSDGELQ